MNNFDMGWLLYLSFLVIIFLIFRELVCWYWKINRAVASLESIDDKLSTLIAANKAPNDSSTRWLQSIDEKLSTSIAINREQANAASRQGTVLGPTSNDPGASA